ncbi:MAG: metallophosphoesterase family protein, partial [Phototrophicaceae bacterium]
MSKIAVISDTHSNSVALKAVINDFIVRGVERVWMLGDMIGRGVDPKETLRLLAKLKKLQNIYDQQAWLKGNHDTFVTDPEAYQEGVSSTQTMTVVPAGTVHMDTFNRHLLQHRQGDMIWVKEHPTHSQPYPGVYLAHAAYAFDDEGHLDEHATEHLRISDEHNAIVMLDAMYRHLSPKPKLVGFGHTHLTQLWRRTDWGSIERIPIQYGVPIHLHDLAQHAI